MPVILAIQEAEREGDRQGGSWFKVSLGKKFMRPLSQK
jgi:hypothetical protein